ncbi:MAG: MMPL family transporter [Planctomycetaceae bacterium]
MLRGPVGDDGVRRGGVPYVASVYTPADAVQRMVSLRVDQEESLKRLEGVLLGSGWMKVRLTSEGEADPQRSIQEVVRHVEKRLGIKVEVHDRVTDWIDEAYLAEVDARMAEGEEVPEAPSLMIPAHHFQVRWEGMQPDGPVANRFRDLAVGYRGFATADAPTGRQLVEDCFFAVGSPVAVMVTLSEAGAADPTTAVNSLRGAAIACGIPEDSLHLGGRLVTATELNRSVRKAAWNPNVLPGQFHKRSILMLSGLVGLVLAFVFLRSIRLGILVVGVSWYATGLTIGLIPLTGSSMNMVLVVMPTLLMVLSLSAAIHVANYWKHAAHENPETAVTRALQMAKQPCVMASITTAIGLVSLCSSSLTPVRDFGIYSAIGCVLMLGVVLYGLPALLKIWPGGRPSAKEVDAQGWKHFGIQLHRHWALVAVVCVLATGVAIYGLKHFRTETKVVRYFPQGSRIVRDYLFLEENLSGITPIDIVIRFDTEMQERSKFLERMEIVREVVQSIRQHSEISGAISLAEFQPVSERPSADGGRMGMLNYLRRSQGVERAVKSGEQDGTKSMFVVADTANDLVEPGDAKLNGAGDELWRITAQASVMSDINYGKLTGDINARIQAVTRYYPGTSHVVTGTVPLFLRTQEAVLESLIVSFAMAFGIISLVMMWVLKDPLAGLLSMVPNLVPVAFVFGCLSWSGQAVDIGTMITASVALGIAVDGTLHLLTWFRDGIERGQSRFRAMVEALAHCAPALWQTRRGRWGRAVDALPGRPAAHQPVWLADVRAIGAALVADLVLLPALLAGPLGVLIERRVQKKAPGRAAAQVAETAAVSPEPRPVPTPHITLQPSVPQQRARNAG